MADEFDLRGRSEWATPFFMRKWKDHAAEAPAFVAHLYELKASSQKNFASGIGASAKSAHGIFESDFNLLRSNHPSIAKFRAFCDESIREVVSLITQRRFPADQIGVDFSESWFHITNDGGYHDAHVHGGCSWCGIYYLQSGDAPNQNDPSNGVNRFFSPLLFGGMFQDLGNSYLGRDRIDVAPQDGMLFIFPAFLMHSAMPYRGSTDRIVISFNSRSMPRQAGR